MALTVASQSSPLAGKIVTQTTASAVADNNVTGTGGTLYVIDIDNAANPAPIFLKIWNNPSPVVGTTPADWVIRIAASVRRYIAVPEGFDFTALSFAVLAAADQANAVSPAAPVIVRLITS